MQVEMETVEEQLSGSIPKGGSHAPSTCVVLEKELFSRKLTMCGTLQKMCSKLGFNSSWMRISILFPAVESHSGLIPGCFAFS